MYIVTVTKPRPDFRVFIDLLFGFGRNVDSDGGAHEVCSREWRDLYIRDRESDEPKVELYSEDVTPLKFEIKSESKRLEELSALYLYVYCGSQIEKDGLSLDEAALDTLLTKYANELKRAEDSIWHQSNEDNPFPNLTAKDK